MKDKIKQGQGKQCRTLGVKFKEFTGINRENGINLEETGEKNGGEKQKNGKKKYHGVRKGTMVLGRSTMVLGRSTTVLGRSTMVYLGVSMVYHGKIGKIW